MTEWDDLVDSSVKLRYHSEDLRQIIEIIDRAGGQTCDVARILKDLTDNDFFIQRWVRV